LALGFKDDSWLLDSSEILKLQYKVKSESFATSATNNKNNKIFKFPSFHSCFFCFLLLLDGEPIKLPDNLESLPRADHFPTQRHRWNTNEVRKYDDI
jgi:hypothetical protein